VEKKRIDRRKQNLDLTFAALTLLLLSPPLSQLPKLLFDAMSYAPSSPPGLLTPTYTLVPLATSPPSSPCEADEPLPCSPLSIRSLMSHFGKSPRKRGFREPLPPCAASTSMVNSFPAPRPHREPRRPRQQGDVGGQAFNRGTATETHLTEMIRGLNPAHCTIQAEWQRAALLLKPDARWCLLGAVCLSIKDPMEGFTRQLDMSIE